MERASTAISDEGTLGLSGLILGTMVQLIVIGTITRFKESRQHFCPKGLDNVMACSQCNGRGRRI
jgi:hypothetical protein